MMQFVFLIRIPNGGRRHTIALKEWFHKIICSYIQYVANIQFLSLEKEIFSFFPVRSPIYKLENNTISNNPQRKNFVAAKSIEKN